MSGFDINTCKFIMWGAREGRDTFGHIHAAYLRALKYMGKTAMWLDSTDDISQIDFSNSLVLTMNCVYRGLPKRDDCFYVVHNAANDPCQFYFDGLKLLPYGVHVLSNRYSDTVQEIGPDIFFDQDNRSMAFYWGTDLLPHEIEANKPTRVFNSESTVCNYIGSIDGMKNKVIQDFAKAAGENGIEYKGYGGYNNGEIVSLERHQQLIRDSYIAPAFQGQDQVNQGYMSCRIFKNLSYGVMPPVHSAYANELFDGRLIFNTDGYRLFYDARDQLAALPLEELHSLMDLVAERHTMKTKVEGIIKAVHMLENK